MSPPPSPAKLPKVIKEATHAIKRSRSALKDLGVMLEQIEFLRAGGTSGPTSMGEQRLRWTVPVTQPMMLCSQMQRSGGTLLARLFDGHPACFAHPFELSWGRPNKWHWPKLDLSAGLASDEVLAQVQEGWPQRFATAGFEKYSNWTRRHDAEHAPRYPFIFDVELQRRIFAAAVAPQSVRSQRDILNAYLTSLFNAWLDYQNLYRTPKQWVTAFVPKLIMEPGAVDKFFADYPDGLLVTLVRDPGAWLSSASRHHAASGDEAALDDWLGSVDASLRAQAAYPDKVIVLLFEDVVLRTEATMRLLCQRMGLAFSDTLLEPTYNSLPVQSDSSYVPATGIDTEVTERYRQVLTAERLEIVQHKAMPRYVEVQERFTVGLGPS